MSEPEDGKPTLRLLKGELEDAPAATPSAEASGAERPASGRSASERSARGRGDKAEAGVPGGALPGNLTPKAGEIYPNCPVQALGVNGLGRYYLDRRAQLIRLETHSQSEIALLFGGHMEHLTRNFPKFNAKGEPSGWKHEHVRDALMQACDAKGVWSPHEKVRGPGAWPDGEGGVALHCGSRIWHRGDWRQPGEIGGHVYPAFPALPEPLARAETDEEREPGAAILSTYLTWNWKRADTDATLLLGFTAAAMFGGALDWRPMVWTTGDRGTGKSTLDKLLQTLIGGDDALIQASDATEAAIRQLIGQRSIPVVLDELEPDADARKVRSIVKLARQASSGGVVIRGGQDHQGVSFKARNCFYFSSILVSALTDQDISRIGLLELDPFAHGSAAPDVSERRWRRIGQALRARILERWGRWHETLEVYRAELSRAGHSARGCDQYGTLLAMADMALMEDLDPARAVAWASRIDAGAIAKQTGEQSDWQRMLNHLFGQVPNIWRQGEQMTIGRMIEIAAGMDKDADMKGVERALASYGLLVDGRQERARVLIANQHAQLGKLFEGSQWHATGGQTGVWRQAAMRIPGAEGGASNRRFSGVPSRYVSFPLAAVEGFFGEADDPAPASRPENEAGAQAPVDVPDIL